MWERIKQVGRILSTAGNVADWVWRALVLFLGLSVAGVTAWLSTTWGWYWTTFQWAGPAIAFLVSFLVAAIGTLLFSLAAAIYARRGNPKGALIEEVPGPLLWIGGPRMTPGPGRRVQSLGFTATNISEHEVELRQANITSAVDGTRLDLEVVAVNAAGENEIASIADINLIPAGARVELVARFDPPRGVEERRFLETWRRFSLNARDDARSYRVPYNEDVMMIFFPGMVGPRVTVRPR